MSKNHKSHKRSGKKSQAITTVREKKKTGPKPGLPQRGGTPFADAIFDDPENVERLRKYAARCLNYELLAGCMDMHRSTFYKCLDRRPHLREIIAEARAKAIGAVAERLLDDAKDGNTVAQIFALKAQAGWKDRVDVVHSGNVKHEVTLEAVKRIDNMTPEQRMARRAELEQLQLTDTEVIDVEVD